MTTTAASGALSNSAQALGLLAHDLRTPISCICGVAQVALESARQGAQVEEYLTQILGAAHTLEVMTLELLDGAAQERAFDGDELSKELYALALSQVQTHGQTLRFDTVALKGRRFAGDYAALCRVLNNLLSNAAKYTPKDGRISLSVQVERGAAKEVTAVFCVADDGIGMTEDFLTRMYQPFARAKETAQIEGHGLGLASVRRLVERMHGTISVKSRLGEGTTFTVRVPMREIDSAKGSGAASDVCAPRSLLRGCRFLLAEDNELGGQILCALLDKQGAKVQLARNGEEAVRMFVESEPGAFDAVLLDVHMPVMDGYVAAKAIRAAVREDAGRVPIFALTAGGGEDDAHLVREAGMDGCLTKPIDLNALCAMLEDKQKTV